MFGALDLLRGMYGAVIMHNCPVCEASLQVILYQTSLPLYSKSYNHLHSFYPGLYPRENKYTTNLNAHPLPKEKHENSNGFMLQQITEIQGTPVNNPGKNADASTRLIETKAQRITRPGDSGQAASIRRAMMSRILIPSSH